MKQNELVQIGTIITKEQHERIRQYAHENRMSMAEVIRAAIEHFLKKKPQCR